MPNLSSLCRARRNIPGSKELPDMCAHIAGHTIDHEWDSPLGRIKERRDPKWIEQTIIYDARTNKIWEQDNERVDDTTH